jgi:hypothetical protein
MAGAAVGSSNAGEPVPVHAFPFVLRGRDTLGS